MDYSTDTYIQKLKDEALEQKELIELGNQIDLWFQGEERKNLFNDYPTLRELYFKYLRVLATDNINNERR